ncbi:CGNR zinc finger domain-containing protein [Streptomyces violascens]|nr:ABATE domain-containing protein [Streptomyces violascens]
MERGLALELASTIRHDGDGGVADDLDTLDGTKRWLAEAAPVLAEHVTVGVFDAERLAREADEELRLALVALREAVRALFARAVRPGPPSPADAQRLLPLDEALSRINAAAALEPVTPVLEWEVEGPPAVRQQSAHPAPRERLLAALARASVGFLTGPERERLRACTAPRCVRYFLKSHGRQEWCKPSCGNRARAARHYRRQRSADD